MAKVGRPRRDAPTNIFAVYRYPNDKVARGFLLVNGVLSGCAAYRTQLFLYLKACGREELGTMNLWAGIDAPAAAV